MNDAFPGSNTNRNIELLNGANNNVIRYINSTAADATVAGAGSRNILVGSVTSNLNNTIEYCVVTGGLRGIQDFGQSDLLPNSGTIIRYNTVQNFGAIGIFAGSFQKNCTITFNNVVMNNYNVLVGPASAGASVTLAGIQQQATAADNVSNINDNTISIVTTSVTVTNLTGITDLGTGIENMNRNVITNLSAPLSSAPTNGNFLVGISLGTATGGGVATFNISGNKVSGISTTGSANVRGLSVFPLTNSIVNLNNNFLSLTDANPNASAVFGLLFGNTAGYNYTNNTYFNSVRIGGTATGTGSSYGIFKSDANATSTYNQKNNIAVNERSGGTGSHYGFYASNTTGTLIIDYNNYYSSGTAGTYAAYWNATSYVNSNLAGYKTAASPNEQNTTFANVTFVSSTDLHLSGASNGDADLRGTPAGGITTDIDNQARSSFNPYKGADEGNVAFSVQLTSFAGRKEGRSNILSWNTSSETNNKGFDLERSADGNKFSSIGFINTKAEGGNSTSGLDYSFTDEKALAGTNYYRLRQVDRDGKSTYSSLVTLKGDKVSFDISALYPNPVRNELTLSVVSAKKENLTISIADLAGKELKRINSAIIEGDNNIHLNVTALPAGTYYLRLTCGTETKTTKFIKN